MTVLKITSFGGEIPRVEPRTLPPDAAQANRNLLATASEFRPLQQDAPVGTAPVGTRTLYRMSRDASGALHTDEAQGWLAEVADKNYVKGQLNDDATERTYLSFNDGTQAPRVIDAKGQNRLLGVPAPTKPPTVALEAGGEFTRDEAEQWLSGTLIPELEKAVKESIPNTEPALRQAVPYDYHGAVDTTYPTSQRGVTEPWNVVYAVPAEWEAEMSDPRLLGVKSGNTLYLPFTARTGFAAPNADILADKLRLLLDPVTGSQLLDESRIATLVATARELFDLDSGVIKTKRTQVTDLLRDFTTLAAGGYTGPMGSAVQTYYNQSSVRSSMEAAKDNAAAAIYDACMLYSQPPDSGSDRAG